MSDELPPPDAVAPASPTAPSPSHAAGPRWAALVVALAVLFGGGIAIGRWAWGSSAATTTAPSPTSTSTAPTTAIDPDATVLTHLVLQHADSTLNVMLIGGGDQVRGQPTLDVCNGTFASEAHRAARLQVAALDSQGNAQLSTEAVLYSTPAESAEAFREIQSVVAKCPNSPVVSPVGEPTVTTHFNARPDGDWPQVPTVDRLAYSFTATDQSGRAQPSIAVYLRRGRALMGVYFPQPNSTPPTISGQSTIAGIVNVFATRLAQLPASALNGP